jgi:hypothetical protein
VLPDCFNQSSNLNVERLNLPYTTHLNYCITCSPTPVVSWSSNIWPVQRLAVFSNPCSLSHTPLTSTATPTPPCPPITQPRFMPQPLHPRTPLLGVVTLQLTLTSITSITATTPSSEAFWGALPASSAVRV